MARIAAMVLIDIIPRHFFSEHSLIVPRAESDLRLVNIDLANVIGERDGPHRRIRSCAEK